MKKIKIQYIPGEKIGECYLIEELGGVYRNDKLKSKRRVVRAICGICGKEFICMLDSLKYGRTKSCGCLKRTSRNLKPPPIMIKHGHSINGKKSSEYIAWLAMKSRCKKSKNSNTVWHGQRGIEVCKRWVESFENFLEDMGNKPSKNHSLDRVDSTGNYCPENCRWATTEQQNGNKSSNLILEFNGKSQCLSSWAKDLGVKWSTLRNRLCNPELSINDILSPIVAKRTKRVTAESRLIQ